MNLSKLFLSVALLTATTATTTITTTFSATAGTSSVSGPLSPATHPDSVQFNTPGAGNPIIPGYFADPTVRKFGDIYYIYATTDGNGGGLGPSQVWVSKDFVNWTIMPMNWPTTHFIWAPDVMERDDNYYMVYCQPCRLYMGVAETPRGPWRNILGRDDAVLIEDRFIPNCITLDGQTLIDDDGSVYLYFGTWGIYPGFGCGVVKLDENMMPTDERRLIVNTEALQFFEAPFPIKRGDTYYLIYSAGSCHDATYHIMYAVSEDGPMGPYRTPENNPLLITSRDGTIHGPGHCSILKEGDEYYIVYHRHDNPHSTRGMHRQVAADRLIFNDDGTIERVEAGHVGIGALAPLTTGENLAYMKPVTVSSYYDENFKPEYAVDDNNGTLWRPATCGEEWIEIDLGEPELITRIWTQFEYATSYYQYKIETSLDRSFWTVYSNKTNNRLAGSPMVDYGETTARYIRLTFTGSEKRGASGAIWNIKVFSDCVEDPPQQLIGLNANMLWGESWYNTMGMLGRALQVTKGDISKSTIDNIDCIAIAPESRLTSIFTLPESFYDGGAWSLSYKIYGTPADALREIISWGDKLPSANSSMIAGYKNKSNKRGWHSVAIVGGEERDLIYLDGEVVGDRRVVSAKSPQPLTIATATNPINITDILLYNYHREAAEVRYDAEHSITDVAPAVGSGEGLLVEISASDYNVSNSLTEIRDRQTGGKFTAEGQSLPVRLKDNRIAFYFEGTQRFESDFNLPESIRDNGPYTITAWILNPETDEHECITELVPVAEDGELGCIIFGNGFNPDGGIIYHNGGYEDFGMREYRGDDAWHHWAVSFDGRTERVYRDGELINAKDIVLRMKRNLNISLGMTGDEDWPFSGYLSTLKIYDTALTEEEIRSEAEDSGENPLLFHLATNDINTSYHDWHNEGSWGGGNTNFKNERIYENAGKIALNGMAEISDLNTEEDRDVKSIIFSVAWPDSKGASFPINLISWDDFNIKIDGATNELIITCGDDIQEITLNHPNGWYHFVLQANPRNDEEWVIWVNGYEYATTKRCVGKGPKTTLAIGDDKNTSVISEVTIFDKSLTKSDISELYRNFITNDLLPYRFKLRAEAISPDYVRLEVIDELGKPLDRVALLYDFFRGSIDEPGATSSDWVVRPDYLFECSGSKRNSEKFTVYIKDLYGNVEHDIDSVIVNISPKQFAIYNDEFEEERDYHDGFEGSIWDGLFGYEPEEFTVESGGGVLRIASAERTFSPFEENHGPLLYREVTGNFLAEVHISYYTGCDNPREGVGYLEGGIMALTEVPLESIIPPEYRRFAGELEGSAIQVVQIGTFPYYSQGNILTTIQGPFRQQFANMKGLELDRYIQLEHTGDYFYIRTSQDGVTWTEMPSSPLYRPDLSDKPLKVGLYQVTYSNEWGEVQFDNFKLWQRK